jgi:hypothetical protein
MSFSEQVLGTHVIANTQGRFSFPLQNCIPVRCKAHRSTFMLRQAETPTVSDLGSKPR